MKKLIIKCIKLLRHIYKLSLRLRLKNKDFSLLASNCNGMFILKDLNLQYRSPFVNLWLYPKDYIRFLQNMDYYLDLDLSFIKENGINYPIGILGDIKIYFQHFQTEKEAYEKWNKRKKRINKNNLFVLMTDRDSCTYEDLKDFDKLPIKNKKVFTKKIYSDIKSSVHIPGFEESESIGMVYEYKNYYSIKRRYDVFDYVKWFNGD